MPLPNDERVVALANELLQTFDKLFGLHPGFRAAHAKGQMLTGTFTPSREAKPGWSPKSLSKIRPSAQDVRVAPTSRQATGDRGRRRRASPVRVGKRKPATVIGEPLPSGNAQASLSRRPIRRRRPATVASAGAGEPLQSTGQATATRQERRRPQPGNRAGEPLASRVNRRPWQASLSRRPWQAQATGNRAGEPLPATDRAQASLSPPVRRPGQASLSPLPTNGGGNRQPGDRCAQGIGVVTA